jgi:neutral trehalase
LFGRVATHRQARQTIRAAQETGLLVKAGLRGSLIEDGEPQQWEGIWATEQDVARQGSDNYAKVPLFGRPFRKFSDKIDDATVMRVETQYGKDGEIYEHYDKDGNPGKKSEYGGAQTGFGWSNAEYVVARERREQREERSSRPRLRMPPVLGRRF